MDVFVSKPNCPNRFVESVLYGAPYHKLLAPGFDALGIRSVTLPAYDCVSAPITGHIDLMCCHIARNRFVIARTPADYNIQELEQIAKIIGPDVTAGYPAEAAYNAAVVGKYAFVSKATTPILRHELINAKLKLIECRQGYTKCAIAVVDEKSIITSDLDIHRKAKDAGLDCLLIEPGYISLPGYDYGFIGGSSVKLGPNHMAFTGTLENHPDEAMILQFLADRMITPLYLTTQRIFDVGSIIPLKQNV